MVQQQPGKQQTEQHHQAADEIGHTAVAADNSDEQTDVGRRQIEEHEDQQEPEEFWPRRDQSGHGIHNDAHDDGRKNSQGNNVKYHLRSEVRDGMVVAVGSLAHKQKAFRREHRQAGECTKSKQRQDKEEETQSVLEALNVVRQPIEEVAT